MIYIKRSNGMLDKWHGDVVFSVKDRILYVSRGQSNEVVAVYGDKQWILATTEESKEGWDR